MKVVEGTHVPLFDSRGKLLMAIAFDGALHVNPDIAPLVYETISLRERAALPCFAWIHLASLSPATARMARNLAAAYRPEGLA